MLTELWCPGAYINSAFEGAKRMGLSKAWTMAVRNVKNNHTMEIYIKLDLPNMMLFRKTMKNQSFWNVGTFLGLQVSNVKFQGSNMLKRVGRNVGMP